MKEVLIALMLTVAIMMVPISASATFWTSLTDWQSHAGTYASVDLPGNTGPNPGTGDIIASWTSMALPYGGFFNAGVPFERTDVGSWWQTWNPYIPGTELIWDRTPDGTTPSTYTAGFTFYPNGGGTPGVVSAFGFEAEPYAFGLFNILLYTTSGTELQTINGNSGATFFGWTGESITGFSVIAYPNVSTDSGGFAMGRFVEGGTAVPEPSTLLLFGSGLAGFGLFRRKLKK